MTVALDPVDLAVLIAYVAGAVALGLWVGRGQRNLDTYLLGGRDLPWWAILGSIVATETSTVTFLSIPGLAYAAGGDLRFLQLALGYIVGRVLIVAILLPHYFRGRLYTAYEVLDRRFGGSTRRTASAIFVVTRTLADGLRLFLTAIVLEQVVGWPLPACIAVIGIATILYTVVGGMRSVVWNDCVQMLVYVAGGAIALGFIVGHLPGGLDELRAFAAAEGKLRIFDPTWDASDPFTLWAGLIGGMFLTLGTHGTDQMLVQRYLCARSERDAGRALIGSGVVVLLQFALFLLLGVALAAYAARFWPGRTFESNDRVFATFIVEALPRNVGLIGVLLAAVFAAAMSTLSSSLNASAAAAVGDFYLPRRPDATAGRQLAWTRRATVVFGVLQIAVGILAADVSRSVVTDVLAIAGFAAGLLLGVFLLGVLLREPGQVAAIGGLAAGLAVLLAVRYLGPHAGVAIAWPWYPMIGAVVTFTTGAALGALRR